MCWELVCVGTHLETVTFSELVGSRAEDEARSHKHACTVTFELRLIQT